MKKVLTAISLFATLQLSAQKFEGLATRPPMGWNSWNTFQVNINENMVKAVADVMVSSGMKEAGYEYIVLDDGWMTKERDANGNLVPDPEKFPSGMKALADYVHSKGLKFGLYNCAGTKTCAGYPGTRGYEYQDARFYAAIGIDYLKYDWCNTDGINAKEAYTTMSNAIRTAGRPVVFSLCEWGGNQPWLWAAPVGHLWRTTGDIYNCFDCIKDHGTWKAWGAMQILDQQKNIRQYAGPGQWNDPDMLEVGNGMVVNEDRAHFSMWAMLAAPLMAGNDLRAMNTQTTSILTNKEVVAVDQDASGIQGFQYKAKDSVETWLKPLSNGSWAVCFLNRSAKPQSISFNWKEKSITDELSKVVLDAAIVYKIRNLWTKQSAGTTANILNATIPSHDVLMLRLDK
ncbi:MAG: glycoside hydrolase family 27 protein [Chitinophagaceae bacterium]